MSNNFFHFIPTCFLNGKLQDFYLILDYDIEFFLLLKFTGPLFHIEMGFIWLCVGREFMLVASLDYNAAILGCVL